jgi:enamine deaminase RidA (YjgF/YER057c/UK114 family)
MKESPCNRVSDADAYAVPAHAQPAAASASQTPPTEVTYFGSARSAISNGVILPADRAILYLSGVGPSRAQPPAGAPAGTPAPTADTKAQAQSELKNIAMQLADHGLSMKDVIYLRAYVVPDPAKDHKMDMMGWSAAYGEVFGTAENPTKPARATIGVAALVGADQLIEIEIIAAYPK